MVRQLPSVLVFLFLGGCIAIPEEEIQAFTASYTEVDRASRAVYAEFENVTSGTLGISDVQEEPSRFGARYRDYLVRQFEDEEPSPISDALAARYAALDAMVIFNDGLQAIVEGRGAEEIKAVVAPLEIAATAIAGPAASAIGPVIAFAADAIADAEARSDLVSALTDVVEIPVKDAAGDKIIKTYTGHPADVLLQALQDDAKDMNAIVIGKLAERVRELRNTPSIGRNPTTDSGKLLYANAYDDAEKILTAIRDYRGLLADARRYFAEMRAAALGQSAITQTAEFIEIVIGMRAEARTLLKAL